MSICFNCSDRGMEDGCPICGKLPQIMSVVVDKVVYQQLDFIPQGYQAPWDPSILVKDHLEYENNPDFKKYVETLDKLVNTIKSGRLPKQSAIIMSSPGMAKTFLAYTCLSLAASHGFKVGPLIDNAEYRRINNISVDPYLTKQFLDANPKLPTIDTIINSDLQFMYIDPTCWRDAYRDLQSILYKRDRQGKPTIFLSCNTLNQIAATDWKKEFYGLFTSDNMSSQKQLRVVQMFLG